MTSNIEPTMRKTTRCVNAHDRCYDGAGGPCPYCERVAQATTETPLEWDKRRRITQAGANALAPLNPHAARAAHVADLQRRMIEAAEFMEQGRPVFVPVLLREAAGVLTGMERQLSKAEPKGREVW